MKKNNGMGIIQMILSIALIVAVIGTGFYFARKKYREVKAESIKTDMLQVQWKLKDYIDKQTVKGEEKQYLGTKVSEMEDNEIIADFLTKNVIPEEEYDKYYVLQDENLAEAGLEITNYEGGYFIINYDTYEIIDTKGYSKPNGEMLYKLTDINNQDEESDSKENNDESNETENNIEDDVEESSEEESNEE